MEVPNEFRTLVRRFDSDSIPEPFNEKVWVANVTRRLAQDDRDVIRKFLDAVLASVASGQELQAIWQSGPPEFVMSDEHVRTMLMTIREHV